MLAYQPAAMLATLALIAAWAGADPMTTPGEMGSKLVVAVAERIDASCVFPEDKLITRRIAYVASLDGNDPNTFRNGFYGGIWQVNETMFDQTKLTGTLLNAQRLAIRANFSFDWMTVTWQDLTKPLHSALAARLFIHNRGSPPAVIPRDVDGQATFYVRHYDSHSLAADFTSRANSLTDQSVCKNGHGADIVFVLDGSGSIGASNFPLIRNFVKSAVEAFDVGTASSQTRIGVIQFGTAITHEFTLATYTNKSQMIAAVDRIPYRGGGTPTHLGLDAMTQVAFTEQRGARPLENGHPRVGIVVTDGVSDNTALTTAAARRAHAADITVLSVGVAGARDTELRAMASDPVCLHVIMLTGFTEFDSLKDMIQKRACDAPIIISIEQGSNSSLDPGKDINCKIKVPPPVAARALLANDGTEKGLTLRVWTTTGNATFYLSNVTYPSAYFHDQLVRSVPGEPGVVYIESGNAEGVVYANIEGSATQVTTFRLEAVSGDEDHCQPNPCKPVEERCIDTGDSFECKLVQIDHCQPNPCDPVNERCIDTGNSHECRPVDKGGSAGLRNSVLITLLAITASILLLPHQG